MKKITSIVILLALLSIMSNVVFASSTNSTNSTNSTTRKTLTAEVTAPVSIEAYDGGTTPKTVDVTIMFDTPVSKGAFAYEFGTDENVGYNDAYLFYKENSVGAKTTINDSHYLEFDLGEKTTDKIVITFWADGEPGYSSIVKFVAKEGSFGVGDEIFDEVIVKGEPKITLTNPRIPELPDSFDQSDGPGVGEENTNELSKWVLGDNATGIEATVNAEASAKLKVEKLKEETDAYKKLKNEMKYNTITGAYDVSIENGKYEGDILVSFVVDLKYEGKDACVLHLKSDGTIEKLENKVNNGRVEVVVSELSPFLVAIDEPKVLDQSPRTGDNFAIPVVASLMLLTLGAIIKLRKD